MSFRLICSVEYFMGCNFVFLENITMAPSIKQKNKHLVRIGYVGTLWVIYEGQIFIRAGSRSWQLRLKAQVKKRPPIKKRNSFQLHMTS
jgi:hypothetical protein